MSGQPRYRITTMILVELVGAPDPMRGHRDDRGIVREILMRPYLKTGVVDVPHTISCGMGSYRGMHDPEEETDLRVFLDRLGAVDAGDGDLR